MIKIVLIDWNSTMADDFAVWWNAIKEIFYVFRVRPPTIREYFEELKTGDFLGIYRKRGINAAREELNEIYEAFYQRNINKVTLFPKVKSTLRFLGKRKMITGLITAQKEYLVSPILNKFNLSNLFDYCECSALNKTEVICRILHQEKIKPRECYFVGDMPSDIYQGKKAKVRTAAFLNLPEIEDLVMAAKPDCSIRSFGEIREKN